MIAGRYVLDREIGRGGMGAVWLGRDEVLGRAVALKRIGQLAGAATPDFDRAEREARLAARLNHPHVVAVFDLVREREQQWLVMEYVEGATLSELVREQGPLTPDQAAPIIAQASEALAAAHRAGIVHRDVKPSNMLVTAGGQVKLSDFGIARAQADATLTQTGLVTGSPAYLAPEVAQGKVATSASDSWSLGATLFHALSGHPPYEVGDNVLGALYRIVHEAPPRLDGAGWLTPVLEHTMTRDPAQRWEMTQVRGFLDAGPTDTVVRPLSGRRGRRATSAAPAPTDAPTDAPADEGTRVIAAVPRVSAPTTSATASPADAVAASRARRSGGWLGALVVLVAVLVLAVVALTAGLGDDDASPDAGATSTLGSSAAPQQPPQPTAQTMRAFVRDYLSTAARDPSEGYAMLTPAFQQESNLLAGYEGFWGRVERVVVDSVEADPADLSVSYRYSYTLDNGETLPDDVSLRLAYDDGTYLIAEEL